MKPVKISKQACLKNTSALYHNLCISDFDLHFSGHFCLGSDGFDHGK